MGAQTAVKEEFDLTANLAPNLENTFNTSVARLIEKRSSDLDSLTNKLSEEYKKVFGEVSESDLARLKNLSGDIDSQIVKVFSELREMLNSNLGEYIKIYQAELATTNKLAQTTIIAYQETQVNRLRENIFDILNNIALETFARSLNFSSQREFIFKLLESAIPKEDEIKQ